MTGGRSAELPRRRLPGRAPLRRPRVRRAGAGPGPAQRRHPAHRPPAGGLLGSSGYSAQLAARLGRPFAFAAHFNPRDVVAALRPYRERFTPSEALSEPYALVSFTVAASEDEREACRQAGTLAHAMLRMFQRESSLLPSPEEVDAYPTTPKNARPSTAGCPTSRTAPPSRAPPT